MVTKIKDKCFSCGLPKSFPGIRFDENNNCNYCAYHNLYKEREELIRLELKDKFTQLIKKVKRQKNKYDCIVAYSGGKDSTFLLYFLKTKLKLNILAHTLDNGCVCPRTFKNIKKVTGLLGIESVITRPDTAILKEVFCYALTHRIGYPHEVLALTSQVCAVCIGMVLGTTFNLAIKLKIPLVFVGFTPGQYPAISLENFLKVQSCIFLSHKVYRDDPLDVLKIIADPIRERFGEKAGKYFFKSQYVNKDSFIPQTLFPYHAFLNYDEKEIYRTIEKIGWVKPKETDSCSTNCMLNSLGNYANMKQFGYHPYDGELSYMVREGKMSLEERLKAVMAGSDSKAMYSSLKFLGLKKEDIKNFK